MKMSKQIIISDKEFCAPVLLEKRYSEEGGKWYIEGIAALTGPDIKEPIIELTPEALKKMIKDLDDLRTVFLEHDWKTPVGVVVDKKIIDGNKLWVKILISKTARDVWQMIKEGVLNSLSIGGKVLKAVRKFDEKLGKFVYKVLDARLYEISIVGLPANPKAKIERYYVTKSMLDAIGGNMDPKEIIEERKEEERIEKEIEKEEEFKKNSEEENSSDNTEGNSSEQQTSENAEGSKEENDKESEEVGEEEEFEKAKKKKDKEEYPEPYQYGIDIVAELKKIARMKSREKMVEAIKELIDKIKSTGYYYYEKEAKKSLETEVENKQKQQEQEQDLVLKTLNEIKEKQVTEDKVREIVKQIIEELPDPSAFRKSQVKESDRVEEIKKAFEALSPEQKLELILKKKYGVS